MSKDYQNEYYERPAREESHSGTMLGLGLMGVGLLVLIVAFTVIPIIGSELDDATIGMVPAGSSWNSTENPSIPTGANLWQTVSGVIKVAAVFVLVAGFLTTLKGLKGRGSQGYQ